MNYPTLRQLQYLVAVIEHKHFGQAAKRCFVSQPTLSTGISELESVLGNTLIERTKRKVMPTQLGLEVADKAREILYLNEELIQLAQADRKPLCRDLHLGVIPTIGPYLWPLVLHDLRQRYPQLKLFLHEEQSHHIIRLLNEGVLDAAIIALPYEIDSLEYQTFWQENFYVVFHKDHPLNKESSITSDKLPKNQLLLLQDGHCLRDHTLSACHFKPNNKHVVFEGSSLNTLIHMVAGQQGITFIPEMSLHTEMIKNSELSVIPLAEEGPHRELSLIWRKSAHKKSDLQLLATEMNTILTQFMKNHDK